MHLIANPWVLSGEYRPESSFVYLNCLMTPLANSASVEVQNIALSVKYINE
jgi:hypothetical protein